MADKRDILIRLLGEETVSRMAGKAGDGLDRFGDKLDATEKDAKHLDRQIGEVERDLKQLAVAFSRTGDAADRVDITKAIRRQQTELRKLTKAKDLLDFDKLGDEAAHGFVSRFAARLGPMLADAPPLAVAGTTLGAAMAPTLLAGLAGAVVGGAGIGGIVGGALIAARDPRVKAAGGDLGQYIMGDLEDRAAAFTPVMLNSITRISRGWAELGPDLDRIFSSSRLVEPLVDGMVSGGKKFIHGVADAVEKSEPVVAALGRSFDAIGDSTGDFFTSLADDADEGASAIDDLTMSVTNLVEATGAIIHAGAAVKGWSNELDVAIDKGRYWLEDSSGFADIFEHFGSKLDLTADGFNRGTVQAEAYRKATLGTAEVADFATLKLAGMTDAEIAGADASGTYRGKIDKVNTAIGRTGPATQPAIAGVRSLTEIMDDWAGKSITVEQAQSNLEQAIDDATAAAQRNGDGIDRNDPKQRANRDALVGIASAARDAAAKIYAQTGSQEAASVATERGRKKFLETAAAMKVEKAEAIALANELFGIPNITRTVKIVTKFETHGRAQGEHTIGQGTQLKGLSSGGMVRGPGPKGVDSEPRLLAPGEGVLTASEIDAAGGPSGFARLRAALRGTGPSPAAAIGAAANNWGPATPAGRTVIELRSGGSRLDDLLVEMLRRAIADRGGNVQTVLGR